jgi:hypothetical protein
MYQGPIHSHCGLFTICFHYQGDLEKSMDLPVSPQVRCMIKNFLCFLLALAAYVSSWRCDSIINTWLYSLRFCNLFILFHPFYWPYWYWFVALIPMQCDRYTTSLAKSQAGFISFVVLPAYKVGHPFHAIHIHSMFILEMFHDRTNP